MKKEPISLEIKYLGRTPRTFPTPIPFKEKSGQTGEVVCNPTGIFDYSDGKYLLSLDPMFQLVREIYADGDAETVEAVAEATEVLKEVIAIDKPKRRGNPNWIKKNKAVPA